MKYALLGLILVAACSGTPTAPHRDLRPSAGVPSRDYICVEDPGGQPTYGTCETQYGASGYIVSIG